MSEQVPPSTPSRYTGGQIAMLVIGAIMLIPGACSLLFLIGMASDLARGDPIVQAIAWVWIVCFFISAAGVALIHVARKDARAAASKSQSDGNP